MGKGTKHKCDWKPTTLDAAIAAQRLHKHTALILGNPNAFKPKYDLYNKTLLEAFNLTLAMYRWCYMANEISVGSNPVLACERLGMQHKAIVDGKWLQAVQDLIRGQFHVDTDKFWNWAEMTEITLNKIKAWHESDRKRYGDLAATVSKDDFSCNHGTGENGSRLSFGCQRPSALG